MKRIKKLLALTLAMIMVLAMLPYSDAAEAAGMGSGGTGARSWTDGSGNVFLGGNFFEVGLSKTGSFGTSQPAPRSPASPYFHPQPSGLQAAQVGRLGMVSNSDPTGAESGWNKDTGDYFMPGGVDEGFLIGWNGTRQIRGSEIGTSVANLGIASSITVDESFGTTLRAVTYGTSTSLELAYEQVVEFEEDEKFFTTTVTLTNITKDTPLEKTLTGVRYMRRFDPDHGHFITGSYATLNVVGHPALNDYGKSVFAYRDNNTTSPPFFFFSGKADSPGATDVQAGYVHNPSAIGFDALYTASRLNTTLGSSVYNDTSIFIYFDYASIAPGASVTFKYMSSLDTDVESAISFITKPEVKIDPNGDIYIEIFDADEELIYILVGPQPGGKIIEISDDHGPGVDIRLGPVSPGEEYEVVVYLKPGPWPVISPPVIGGPDPRGTYDDPYEEVEVGVPVVDPLVNITTTVDPEGNIWVTIFPSSEMAEYGIIDPTDGAFIPGLDPGGDGWTGGSGWVEGGERIMFGPLDPGTVYEIITRPKNEVSVGPGPFIPGVYPRPGFVITTPDESDDFDDVKITDIAVASGILLYVSNTKTVQEYAVIDINTGKIAVTTGAPGNANWVSGNGGTLTFGRFDPEGKYRIVTRLDDTHLPGPGVEYPLPISPDDVDSFIDPNTGDAYITVEDTDSDYIYVVVGPKLPGDPGKVVQPGSQVGTGGELVFGPVIPGEEYEVVLFPRTVPPILPGADDPQPRVGPSIDVTVVVADPNVNIFTTYIDEEGKIWVDLNPSSNLADYGIIDPGLGEFIDSLEEGGPGWVPGGGKITFGPLEPGTVYEIITRPKVSPGDPSYNLPTGPFEYGEQPRPGTTIITPRAMPEFKDIGPDDITIEAGMLIHIDNTVTTQQYAVIDIKTGKLAVTNGAPNVTGWVNGNDDLLTFGVFDPNGSYRIVTRDIFGPSIPGPGVTILPPAPPPGGGGGGGGGGTTGPTVIVDDKIVNIGTVQDEDDTRIITFDQDALTDEIDGAENYVHIILPYDDSISSFEAVFVVKNVDDMAEKEMVLTITIGTVSYEIPTTAIDTAAIMEALGAEDPAEVPITITITKTVDSLTKSVVDKALADSGMQQVVPPMQFVITATYGGKSVEVKVFDQFVGRIIEVTADQARRITTGIVVEDNGLKRHVPTDVFSQSGKHYARINSLTNSTYVLIYYDVGFPDVRNKWYASDVDEMASRTIVQGRENGLYHGEDDITRAEFAAIIIRSFGLPPDGNSRVFSDVPANAWYAGYVGKAFEYGIIQGVGGDRFEPNRFITRQEAMLMIQRAAVIAELTGRNGDISIFPDAGNVSSWAINAARWNVGSGLIVGRDGGLQPGANISRAETATLVLRLLRNADLVDVRIGTQPDR